tara:strand:- start:470 stop:604 length:135 start_codon:yes stop_codon:yes gene_type:complete
MAGQVVAEADGTAIKWLLEAALQIRVMTVDWAQVGILLEYHIRL